MLNTVNNTTAGATRMASSRYYATQTVLADGRVLITGGTAHGADATYNFNDNPGPWGQMSGAPEVYTSGPSGGSWETLAGAASVSSVGAADAFGPRDNKWWYPRQWVSPADGKVFGISTHQMWYLDPTIVQGGVKGSTSTAVGAFKSGVGTLNRGLAPNVGPTSTAVMYDVGKILQVGGNGRMNADATIEYWTPSSNAASIFDINTAGQVSVRDTNPLTYWRHWANATVLPNGKVVVTGGTGTGNKVTPDTPSDPGLGPIHHAEIWDPVSEVWTLGPPASVARVYHSTAVLLPNGTVLTAGSGGPPGWTLDNPAQYNAEVYYPAYLFQTVNNVPVLATRPRILSMNARKFSHGAEVRAEVSVSATDITKAVLIGLGAVTHSFDMGQRLYPVPVPALSKSGTQVWFPLPDANKTPPGYYYLFVVKNGVPSEGVIIAIGANVAPPPPRLWTTTDFDGDGKSDPAFYRPPPAGGNFGYAGSASFYNQYGILFGLGPGDVPLSGDFDGDGKTDPAFYRPPPAGGNFGYAGSASFYNQVGIPFGLSAGDIPLVGDFDGDGKSDPAFYRPPPYGGNFGYASSANGYNQVGIPFGLSAGDIPLVGDFDGDGKADPAFYRPPPYRGNFGYASSANGYNQVGIPFGLGAGDIPLVGDFDGDGRAIPRSIGRLRPVEISGMRARRASTTGRDPLRTRCWRCSAGG